MWISCPSSKRSTTCGYSLFEYCLRTFSAFGGIGRDVRVRVIGSRNNRSTLAEMLPGAGRECFIHRRDRPFELRVAGVEMWRDPNAGVRPVVHNDIAREQELRDLVGVRNIECHGPTTTISVSRGANGIPALVGQLDQPARLPSALGPHRVD